MGNDWRLRAACRDHPEPDLWFPTAGDARSGRRAKSICAGCPVVEQCGAEAIRSRCEGIWGGVRRYASSAGNPRASSPGRRSRKAGATKVAPAVARPSCGTKRGVRVHRAHGEPVCRACKDAARVAYEAKYGVR